MYKDKSLDAKIIEVSQQEFLDKGFRNASLRNISSKAGITTGALYTRYKNKDELFKSLIKLDLNKLAPDFNSCNSLYLKAKKTKDVKDFLLAIKTEEKVYLDLLFNNYLGCTLLITKSEGSKIYEGLLEAIENKKNSTIKFFKEIQNKPFDLDIILLLMDQNINFYRQILMQGYDKEKAQSLLKSFEIIVEASFKRVFEEII